MRIMAVDPGDVRIGLAISDEAGIIARPLKVIRHRSRPEDVRAILREAEVQGAECIIVGVALDLDGNYGPQARKGLRLAEALQESSSLRIETWDESGSTQQALRRKKKDDRLDARAAAVILQEYLNETGAQTGL
jgi:putative Holliday junction resolvase